MLTTAASGAARAAPTPGPTPEQPQQPMRVPGVAPSPSAALPATPAPLPATPAPMRAPAVVASPSPAVPTPSLIPTTPTPAPLSSTARALADATTPPAGGQPTDDTAETVEAPPDWQAFVPTDIADHLATMDRAARESGCGVPWHLLAAIARVESDFGRNMATSSAGAMGYGQFLPSSWRSFGNDGNVYDYRAALPAIATYLCQSGLERDPRAALFAYNHADWYVDLVLDLAVRYDRMAPGAPTPDVLDVGPAADSGPHLHYAAGRDVRRESRRHTVDGQADWLGIPWHGRAPGAAISAQSLETTTLAMMRSAFGLTPDPPRTAEVGTGGLTGFADRAWNAGLLAAPIELPVSLPVPDELRPTLTAQWSIGEIRRSLDRGQPLVALVAAQGLPGHSPGEGSGDQPLVLIGKTPTGLVYSDPSFSSSLGYGLELSDADFLAAWLAASTPGQAVAFSQRPAPLGRDAHVRVAQPPPVRARVFLATPEVTPEPTSPGTVEPTSEETPAITPEAIALAARPTETASPPLVPAPPEGVVSSAPAAPVRADNRAWLIVLGAAAAFLGALFVRRWRARRTA